VTRVARFDHVFVETIPDVVEPGILYVSTTYGTAIHRCACGCGNEVVTPVTPTDWTVLFDGETVSLRPSIGNWGFVCESHYWIKRNRVQWAPGRTSERTDAGRPTDEVAEAAEIIKVEPGIFARFVAWLRRR
jgi:hypothetical protein